MTGTFSRRRGIWPTALALAGICLICAPSGAEAAPKFSVNDTVTDEPGSAADPAAEATFTIKLSRKAKRTARVDYATTDDTAQSDGDYTHTAGTAAIKKGKKKQSVVVPINGDDLDEDAETFNLKLSNPSRAAINDDTGIGTITDTDDTAIVINEVDYDQAATDTASFIEVFNPTPNPASLADLAVVGVSGGATSTGTEYSRFALSGAGASLASGQYLVIGNPTVIVPIGALTIGASGDFVQNGPNDAVALINTSDLTLVDAFNYEAADLGITAATITGFSATVDLTDDNTRFAGSDTNDDTTALARTPNGADTDNQSADWALTTTLSPGAANP